MSTTEREGTAINPVTQKAIDEAQDIIDGKIEAKSYSSAHEMFEDILGSDNGDIPTENDK